MFEWIIRLKVDETLVADGFNATQDRVHGAFHSAIMNSYGREIEVEILSAPKEDDILRAQGYKDKEEMEKFVSWKKEVDCENSLDSFDLALGYFSGKGYEHEHACEMAEAARNLFRR